MSDQALHLTGSTPIATLRFSDMAICAIVFTGMERKVAGFIQGLYGPLRTGRWHGWAQAIADMRLKYVVITSVDRDDLRDGGAQHFADCLREIRKLSPSIQLETLVPDYRGRMDIALDITASEPPDVFNHNLETVPRLYKSSRPGSDFEWSLDLLEKFKQRGPGVPTKSGLMLGLGETDDHTWIWIPERRTIVGGDFIVSSLPNPGTPCR